CRTAGTRSTTWTRPCSAPRPPPAAAPSPTTARAPPAERGRGSRRRCPSQPAAPARAPLLAPRARTGGGEGRARGTTMSSKAITDKPEERPATADWQGRETAPSVLREDDLQVPRIFRMLGAALVIFGGMALAFNLSGRAVRLPLSWSLVCLTVGLAGLLFHAAFDRDVQFRRMYMAFGFALLLVGAVLSIYPHPKNPGDQFRYGVPCIALSLAFLLAYLRNETDEPIRRVTEYSLLGAGAVMAAVGLVGGHVKAQFLVPYGLVLAVFGVVYLAAFIGTRGVSDNLAFRTGQALGAVGAV